MVSTDAAAVEKGYVERHALLLHQIEQALPNTGLGSADEEMYRQPPGPKIVWDAAPLGAVLVPPENGWDGSPEVLRCFAERPDLLDQWLPHCPDRIRETGRPCPSSYSEHGNSHQALTGFSTTWAV
jgi:hypothetical protein